MHSESLAAVLNFVSAPAVAVSGGVDSVTLAAFAATLLRDVVMVHAISPAVPAEATTRVSRLAQQRGWRLKIIDAGEFDDPNYRANPVNRCFYCKTNLYGVVRKLTQREILSGANLDDLGEYRPGLDAARAHAVRHPYIEAGMDKKAVRALARSLDLKEVSELPASPCLSSRIETGIPIEDATLSFIHRVERRLTDELRPKTIRCRVRADVVVIELDQTTLELLREPRKSDLLEAIRQDSQFPGDRLLDFEPYRNGSAFLIHRIAS